MTQLDRWREEMALLRDAAESAFPAALDYDPSAIDELGKIIERMKAVCDLVRGEKEA